jgi:hypothetical protein
MQSAKIDLGVCPRHFRQRRIAHNASGLFFVSGVAAIVVALVGNGLPIAAHWRMLGFLTVGVAMLVVSIRANLASVLAAPHKIDRDFVWLKRINSDYLARFPPVTNAAEGPPPY